MRKRAFDLMKTWCDALLTYQVKTHTPYTNGALLCPACHVLHGRIADLCFPLTTIWAETKDDNYLIYADRFIEWSDYNLLREDGLWYNDMTSMWYGTSIFSALSIGESLLHFGDKLPKNIKEKWMNIFVRMTNTISTLDSNKDFLLTVTNYYCGAAALLAMAWKITGNTKYYEKSKFWINNVISRFDENGLLYGEGTLTPACDGSRTIDMGYNLEESLPVLLRYASLTGDYDDLFREKLRSHLDFLLPDGAIDNSWGTRHDKWTYWGSRTSDGLTEGLALVLDDEMFADACERVLTLYENCTRDGLLTMPMAHETGEPTCLHHTFTHAKALAAIVCSEYIPSTHRTTLPCEEEYGIKKYQNGNLILVSTGVFRATFSSCKVDYHSPNNATGGGSMNLLYHRDNGILCAATSVNYIPIERLNQQLVRKAAPPPCMTTQFIVDGNYGCRDSTAVITADSVNMSVTAKADSWEAVYTFAKTSLEINLSCADGIYSIPFVCSNYTNVSISEDKRTVQIGSISLTSNVPVNVDPQKRVFHPVGGFVYLPITLKVCGTATLRIK